MRHDSWKSYEARGDGTPLQRAARLAGRDFMVGVTVEETATALISPITFDTVTADAALEVGSVDWCNDLAQKLTDSQRGDSLAVSFVEDLADVGTPLEVRLEDKPGAVTFFIKHLV